jgi:hypothetical protein
VLIRPAPRSRLIISISYASASTSTAEFRFKITVDYQINAVGYREVIYAFKVKYFIYELRYSDVR